jgi:hypothetical protein
MVISVSAFIGCNGALKQVSGAILRNVRFISIPGRIVAASIPVRKVEQQQKLFEIRHLHHGPTSWDSSQGVAMHILLTLWGDMK